MKPFSAVLLAGLLAVVPPAFAADDVAFDFGGDHYGAGQNVSVSTPVARDAFLAGSDVSLAAPVSGDAHLAGFTVNSSADVTGNLYAAGFAVTVNGNVAGDITAMGNSVVLRAPSVLPGNARLAGATIVIDAPVDGAVLASSGSLTLNAAIKGDFSFYGEAISFGPNARIDGKVAIQAPKPIDVPASVAAADRVTYTQISSPDYASEAGRTAGTLVKGFWFALWAAVLWWLLLLVIGAATISLLPVLVNNLQIVGARRPFRRLGLGLLAFASVIGLVPVAAMTLIGLFLVPFVLIFVVAACSVAYLAGVYLVGVRIIGAATPVDSVGKRIGVLALSLVVAGLLTMIPVLGWLFTLLLLTFGFGVIAAVTMAKWGADDAARLTGAPPSSGANVPGAV